MTYSNGLADVPYGDDIWYPDVGTVAVIPTLEPGPGSADLFSGSAVYWMLGAGVLLLLVLAGKKGRR